MKTILIVGRGGRESALALGYLMESDRFRLLSWPKSLRLSGFVTEVFAPEKATLEELVARAKNIRLDLVILGPEVYIERGFADAFVKAGVPCFAPSQAAGRLETSKAYAKSIMQRAGIPTARHFTVVGQEECSAVAGAMLAEEGACVLKASGLAAGKGVVVCDSSEELERALTFLYTEHREAAKELVVESKLLGRECSYFCGIGPAGIVDIGFAVDYKRRYDGHEGPNTGGMGCYTPVTWLPENAASIVQKRVVEPLLAQLEKEGVSYHGFLYVGLMWHELVGPQVVEFNVRLGDPEAQVLAVVRPAGFPAVIEQCLTTEKHAVEPVRRASRAIDERVAVGVVLVSPDYPRSSLQPDAEVGLSESVFNAFENVQVFMAAAEFLQECWYPRSGRIATVVGYGKNFPEARAHAYRAVKAIQGVWTNVCSRLDIGIDA